MKIFPGSTIGLALLLVLTTLLAPVRAAVLHGYEGFGVSGRSLYAFPTLTTRLLLTDQLLSEGQSANHLATDQARNRLLFTRGSDSVAITELYAWDLASGTQRFVGTLSGIGASSGGAGYYNGAYYLYDDQGAAPDRGITKVTFNQDGSIATITKPYGSKALPGHAGLGDIVISASGIMYLSATNTNLYTIDLNSSTSDFQLLRAGAVNANGQLFFDRLGRLLSWDSTQWRVINPATGQHTLIPGGEAAWTYSDLSSAVVAVPEPGTVALITTPFLGLALYRTRRRYP